MKEKINISVLNDINRALLRSLQRRLARVFVKSVRISKHVIIPTSFFNKDKKQYDGRKLLKFLTENLTLKDIKDINLAVFDRDLFAGNLNFIFGLATSFPRICIISIIRLHPHFNEHYFQEGLRKRKIGKFPLAARRLNSKEKTLYYDRILKEAVHEIGHTMGLTHCDNPRCIMYFSNSLEDTDVKDLEFCSSCKKDL